ncbi:MAG TPA: hypothetical protein VLV48_04100, partial [Thermoanaerobaculia bacterium]|nr:hypothetical protein [Thermoanaerobaculia bacterium]
RFDPAGRAPHEWPNVFRPSYRSPAAPALMHVELGGDDQRSTMAVECEVLELARAPHVGEGAIVLDALCARGSETFFASIEIAAERLVSGTASGPRRWFPFGAGAWGRRLAVELALFR